jgi:magnesium chelatase family protein
MDRIDLVVPIVPQGGDAPDLPEGETTAEIRARIDAARVRQSLRLAGTRWRTNAEIPADAGAIELHCAMTSSARMLLRELVKVRRLSPRAQHRLRRVARTIADLQVDRDPTAPLQPTEIAQAAALRCLPDG